MDEKKKKTSLEVGNTALHLNGKKKKNMRWNNARSKKNKELAFIVVIQQDQT